MIGAKSNRLVASRDGDGGGGERRERGVADGRDGGDICDA